MLKVYTNDVLEFEGGVVETAEYIGVSAQTLYSLNSNITQWLADHAKCDYLVWGDVKYDKKPRKTTRKDNDIEINVGFKIGVEEIEYELIKIEQGEYTFKDENGNTFNLKPYKPYKRYNTIYNAIKRNFL